MLKHRFLIETRDGTIPRETFVRWMQQDYLFAEGALSFIAALLTKAPAEHREALVGVVGALREELKLFEERAAANGVDLGSVQPAFTTHAYTQFLYASAVRGAYAEAYTVLYVAEKAYFDSWSVVKGGLDPDSPWYPFVENWAGEKFGQYVGYLEGELDALAEKASESERSRMAEYFELTLKYEIAFWEMAATGTGWPGVS